MKNPTNTLKTVFIALAVATSSNLFAYAEGTTEAEDTTKDTTEVSPFSSPGDSQASEHRPFESLSADKGAELLYAKILPKAENIRECDYLIPALISIANGLSNSRYYDQAEKILEHAQKIAKTQDVSASTKAQLMSAVTHYYEDRKKYSEAEVYAKKAVDESKAGWYPSADPWDHTNRLIALARIQVELGKYDEAERNLNIALDFFKCRRAFYDYRANDFDDSVLVIERRLADCLSKADKFEQASKMWEKVINAPAARRYPGLGASQPCVFQYSMLLEAHNQADKARRINKRYMRSKELPPPQFYDDLMPDWPAKKEPKRKKNMPSNQEKTTKSVSYRSNAKLGEHSIGECLILSNVY